MHIFNFHIFLTSVLCYNYLGDFLRNIGIFKKQFNPFNIVDRGENARGGPSSGLDKEKKNAMNEEKKLANDNMVKEKSGESMPSITRNTRSPPVIDDRTEPFFAKGFKKASENRHLNDLANDKSLFDEKPQFLKDAKLAKFLERPIRSSVPGNKAFPENDNSKGNALGGTTNDPFDGIRRNGERNQANVFGDNGSNDKNTRDKHGDEAVNPNDEPIDGKSNNDVLQDSNRWPLENTPVKDPDAQSKNQQNEENVNTNSDSNRDDNAPSYEDEFQGSFYPVKHSVTKSVKNMKPDENKEVKAPPSNASHNENDKKGNENEVDGDKDARNASRNKKKSTKRMKREWMRIKCKLMDLGLLSFEPVKNCKKEVKSQSIVARRVRSNNKPRSSNS